MFHELSSCPNQARLLLRRPTSATKFHGSPHSWHVDGPLGARRCCRREAATAGSSASVSVPESRASPAILWASESETAFELRLTTIGSQCSCVKRRIADESLPCSCPLRATGADPQHLCQQPLMLVPLSPCRVVGGVRGIPTKRGLLRGCFISSRLGAVYPTRKVVQRVQRVCVPSQKCAN